MIFKDKYTKVLPFILFAFNFIIKGIFIASNSLGEDEPFSIFHAQQDVSSIIEKLANGNNPPFYEILLHFWIKLFGISELSVRFPSLIFSSFTVIFIYLIGKEFFKLRVGIVAALLFIFSNFHVNFAHQARVYALFAMLTSISIYLFLHIINKKKTEKYYVFWLLTNIVLIYSHYFGFFVVFIQYFTILFFKDLRQVFWKKFFVYLFFLFLLYIPNIQVIYMRFITSSTQGTWIQAPNGLNSIYGLFNTFSNKPAGAIVGIFVISMGIIQFFYRGTYANKSINLWTIFLGWMFPLLIVFIISYRIPMFLDRYLVFISISYYLMIAISIEYLLENFKYNYVLSAIVVLLFMVTANFNIDNKRHLREAVSKIKAIKGDKDVPILICPPHYILNFMYYYDKELFSSYQLEEFNRPIVEYNIYPVYNFGEAKNIIENKKQLIYFDAAASFLYPGNGIELNLTNKYKYFEFYEFPDIYKVYRFYDK